MSEMILFASQNFPYAVKLLRDRLGDAFDITVLDLERDLNERVKDVRAIVPLMTEVDEEVMKAMPNLQLIVQWGVGLESVDKKSAREKGIKVRNVPDRNATSVAECSLFLMFCLARKINQLEESFKKREIGTPVGEELRGKNLLIVGAGSSGQKLAETSHGIGMNCRGIRKHPSKGAPEQIEKIGGAEDLDSFLPWADYVSLHLPLSQETKEIFNQNKFKMMKKSAYLVNVSRGGIIAKDDLYDALVNEDISGAGLDVYWTEPPDPNDKLCELPNVVTTPHIAGVTEEAYERIADEITEIIKNNL